MTTATRLDDIEARLARVLFLLIDTPMKPAERDVVEAEMAYLLKMARAAEKEADETADPETRHNLLHALHDRLQSRGEK